MGIAIVVVLAAVVIVLRVHRDDRTDFSRAMDVVPSATLRFSFTDWAKVRQSLHIGDDASPSSKAVASLISRAYNSDYSAVSSIDDSAVALQKHFGFSPATIEWEAYAQADTGAAMVVRMPDGFDFSKVTADLKHLGFKKPGSATGVWLGGTDLVAAIDPDDPTISPELQYVAVLADKHLIVSSDQESYARTAAAVADGKGRSLGAISEARGVADPLTEPAAAMLWSRDFACTDLAMSQASQDDQTTARQLMAAAGETTPLTGLVLALAPDRTLDVSELFESGIEAKENLRARAKLAVGDAPGRGGSFSDDLKLVTSRTDGPTVQLAMKPRTKTGYVLSALDSGPLLFATC
ncbi:MAG TPA: hypothetical protein VFE15_05305 [Marmoricola sp.]|nr:hypothetical protein [Marmoricola sp.]